MRTLQEQYNSSGIRFGTVMWRPTHGKRSKGRRNKKHSLHQLPGKLCVEDYKIKGHRQLNDGQEQFGRPSQVSNGTRSNRMEINK